MVDDVAAVLADGRTAAEALMVDTCRITRPGEGNGPFNQDTGQYDKPPPVTVYEGKCRVQVPSDIANATQVAAGEAEWTVQAAVIQLPVAGSEAVRVHQTVELLDVVYDLALEGRKYDVTALHHKTHATSRRLRVKERTG